MAFFKTRLGVGLFRGFHGSRPYLVSSYDVAFHKNPKFGLNSKMIIGTKIGFIQNRPGQS